jgi:signal transduction histidine kinase
VHIADITRDGLYIDLDTTAYKRQPLPQEEALYRIVQEALNNIVKDAHARRIKITLRAVGGLTSLTVRDEGRGFALELAGVADGLRSRTAGGLGLRIMRERAEALGGRIDGPSSQVLVLTSFGDGPRVRDAIQAEAIGYLLKDVLKADLVQAIRAAVQGQPTLHPEAQRHLMWHVTTPRRDRSSMISRPASTMCYS